jgi:HD-GYP domain-containing protein (c-di-GMP phosphodiesterase class II)
VADAYDAMTSNRPYRNSLGHEEAISELKRYAGIRFAPQVVEAFLSLPPTFIKEIVANRGGV